MSVLSEYKKLLSSQPENKRLFETIEISHSLLSKTYYFVRDSTDLTVTDTAIIGLVFTATNILISNAINTNDLDQLASFTLPDLENTLDDELQSIDFGDTEKPLITYRIYHSDFLGSPAEGPFVYDVVSVSQAKGVFTINTGVPKLNTNRTGITYNLTDFLPLRGFL